MSDHMLIDWFAFTVHAPEEDLTMIWDSFFYGFLGARVCQEFGGRGFERLDYALEGAKIYYLPAKKSDGSRPEYWHIELPSKALACIVPSRLSDLIKYLDQQFPDSFLTKMKLQPTRKVGFP